MSTPDPQPSTSRTQTLIAALVVLAVAVGLFLIWKSQHDPRIDALERMLADDLEVSDYAYRFRVFGIEGNTAVMSTPRSPEMSVLRFLEIIRPDLDVDQPDSPPVIAAQKELARVQYRTREIVMSHPQIDDVRWQLDRQWYLRHGVDVR